MDLCELDFLDDLDLAERGLELLALDALEEDLPLELGFLSVLEVCARVFLLRELAKSGYCLDK